MRAVIGTGGTAGHVLPALAVAGHLRDRLGFEVRFVGRHEGPEAEMVPAAGYELHTVSAVPLRRQVSVDAIRAPFVALAAARRCRPVVRDADVVVGMGGYVSIPVSLAAAREDVPLVVHEQNAVPGLANRVAARWSTAVALGFEQASGTFRRRRTVVTGNPVRDAVVRVREDREAFRAEAGRAFDLDPGRWTLLAFGGSQGARRVNDAVLGAVAGPLAGRGDMQVLWLTGRDRADAATLEGWDRGGLALRTASFVERMELAYAAADVAVCRAGASTIAELTVCGVPAILVPYPHATGGHQRANASALAAAGGAVVVDDAELTAERLAQCVTDLRDDASKVDRMRACSLSFGRPHAAEAVADLVASVAKGDRR